MKGTIWIFSRTHGFQSSNFFAPFRPCFQIVRIRLASCYWWMGIGTWCWFLNFCRWIWMTFCFCLISAYCLMWHCSSNGMIYIKSCYHLGFENIYSDRGSSASNLDVLWKKLWSKNFPKKIDFYLASPY